MTVPGVRFTVDTTPLAKFAGIINLKNGQSPIMGRMFTRIGGAYSAFVRRRFAAYSRGGGGWPVLARSTVAARRRGSGSGYPAILRDSGLLFMALTIGAAGNFFQRIKNGIVYGFADSPHPKTFVHGVRNREGKVKVRRFIGANSKATLRQIAGFHNEGGSRPGHPPRRVILAQPNETCLNQFQRHVKLAVSEAGDAVRGVAGIKRGKRTGGMM